MMNCREATEMLSKSQDQALSLGERIGLKLHLMICSGCRNTERQFRRIRNLLRSGSQHSGRVASNAEKSSDDG